MEPCKLKNHSIKPCGYYLFLMGLTVLGPLGGIIAQEKTNPPTLQPGTVIKASLESELSSTSASKDDRFALKILFATNEGKRVALPRGSKLGGKIVAAKSARHEQAGFITLALDQLILPDGKTEMVNGEMSFPTLKDIAREPHANEVTLRGGVQESEKMSVQSSTSNVPPPSSVDDASHRDIQSPDQRKRETTGTLDLTKRKGLDVVLASGTLLNVKIVEPPPRPAPPKEASKPSK